MARFISANLPTFAHSPVFAHRLAAPVFANCWSRWLSVRLRFVLTTTYVAVFTIGLSNLPASAQEWQPPVATAQELAQVYVVPQEGFNLTLEHSDATGLYLRPNLDASHQWWAATLDGLPTGLVTPLHIGVTKLNEAHRIRVHGWDELRPLITYADPSRYESYAWYYKDDTGMWLNGDPLLPAAQREAGKGYVPHQDILPQGVDAREFLTPDRRTWTPWREVVGDPVEGPDGEIVEKAAVEVNIEGMSMTMPLVPSHGQVSLAMRVPFTYTYLQQFLERLQAAKLPGVFVDEIGTTPEGRKLQVVRIEPLESDELKETRAEADVAGIAANATPPIAPNERPTVVVTAREHATEQASSWMAMGMILELVADLPASRQLRRDVCYLIIPIQDPDGAANSDFDRMTDAFRNVLDPQTPPEVFDYTRYFVDWVDKQGRTLDITLALHNVQADGPHLFPPTFHAAQKEEVAEFHNGLISLLTREGYLARATTPLASRRGNTVGASPYRLHGWITQKFGALNVVYEVGDRYPKKRLAHYEIQGLGSVLARYLAQWPHRAVGQAMHARTKATLAAREKDKQEYYARKGPAGKNSERARFDLLVKGFGGVPQPNTMQQPNIVTGADVRVLRVKNPNAENPNAENPNAENPNAENPNAENPNAEHPNAK